MKIASLPNQSVALLEQLKQWFEINENNKGQIVLTLKEPDNSFLNHWLANKPEFSGQLEDDLDEILTEIRQAEMK